MQKIKLGCRPSKLALIQAEQVKKKIKETFNDVLIDIVPIKTVGDINQTSSLKELGGKGVFIKAIEEALLAKKIDAAVHSFKDITASISKKTKLICFLKPEAITDCVIFHSNNNNSSLATLKKNSVVATSSQRRRLYLQHYYPHLKVKDIRGNVETRIKKCKDGYADAVILSEAGLIRLQLEEYISETLDPSHFVPAPGQGVVAVQTHKEDPLNKYFQSISDPEQTELSSLEYLFLETVGLDCNYPLGLILIKEENRIRYIVKWATLDMKQIYETQGDFDIASATDSIVRLATGIKNKL